MNDKWSGIRDQGSGGRRCGTFRFFFASRLMLYASRGFTLVEVLLALAILAVVLSVIYVSFSEAGRSVESAEEVRGETDLARTLIARLSDDIGNAFCPLGQNNKPSMQEAIFYGKKEEIEEGGGKRRLDAVALTTLTNWRKPASKEMELWEVGYYFEERQDGKGYALMRREKRELSRDIPPLEGGDDFELTDKVEQMQLRYYDGSKWIDEWDSRKQNGLPKAAEIALTLAGGKVYMTQVNVGRQ